MEKSNSQNPLLVPYSGNARLSTIAGFAVMGFDIKQGVNDELRVIEINGIRSGMYGFKDAKVDFNFPNKYIQDIDEFDFKFPGRILKSPCEEALYKHLASLGPAALSYLACDLNYRGFTTYRFDFENYFSDILDEKSHLHLQKIHASWDNSFSPQVEKLAKLEEIIEDKKISDECFDSFRGIKPISLFPRDYAKLPDCEFVVIKPRFGERCEGITVIKKDKVNFNELIKQNENANASDQKIIEPFFASKPIEYNSTGKGHDGCMRYVVLVEENFDGSIDTFHFGGYWRLAPMPINFQQFPNSMIASYTKDKITKRATQRELAQVTDFVDHYAPQLYKSMLSKELKADDLF